MSEASGGEGGGGGWGGGCGGGGVCSGCLPCGGVVARKREKQQRAGETEESKLELKLQPFFFFFTTRCM